MIDLRIQFKISITSVLALSVFHSFGQSQHAEKMKHRMDSIKAKFLDGIAWKNPMLRQASISTEVFAPGQMTSDLYGNSFFKSKYQTTRTNFFFNVPIKHIKKNIFSTTIAASHQTIQLNDVTNYDPSLSVGNANINNTLLRASFSYTRVDSLLLRPVIYSATTSALMNPETDQYRFTFNGVITMTIKRTKNSSLSTGLLVLLDPSAPFPLIPFIGYNHKFKSGLEFFLDPSRIALRKELGPRQSISLSNDIGGTLALFKYDVAKLPHTQAYTTLELKSGVVYENLLTKKLVLSISGGVSNTLKSRVLEQNKFNDPFITNNQSMVPYLKVGISFLPFWKGIF